MGFYGWIVGHVTHFARLRLTRAQDAFLRRDPSASVGFHQQRQMEKFHQEQRPWHGPLCKAAAQGATRGVLVTTVVLATAISVGIALPAALHLILGVLVSYCVCVALLSALQKKTDKDYKALEREREAWECENFIEGEKSEMVDLYETRYQLSREDATTVVDIISKDHNVFVDIMMVEELGFAHNPEEDKLSLVKYCLVQCTASLCGGVTPLAVVSFFDTPTIFEIAVCTMIPLALVGLLHGLCYSGSGPLWRSTLAMVLVGGLAIGLTVATTRGATWAGGDPW